MMRCPEAKELFSDYLEEYLIEPDLSRLIDHLSDCESCRNELDELQQALGVIHDLPRQEPVLDLWAEFVPMCAQFRAESRLGFADRIKRCFSHFRERFHEGAMIFTAVVRYNTCRKIEWFSTGD
jgi:hypothetical protein